MNETLKSILSRRSLRAYKKEQISDKEIQTILEAGKFAPSGMNTQPWHFTVVQRTELLTRINKICRAIILNSGNKVFEDRAKAEGFSVFYHAPTLIVVSGDTKAVTYELDCAVALGYMFLAARSLNIGSCWIHAVSTALNSEEGREVRSELGLTEGYKVLFAGAFGYSTGQWPLPAPRKEDTVTIIK